MRTYCRRCAMLAGAVLASVLIIEFILRIGFPEYSPANRETASPHPVYGAYLEPGRRVLRTGYGFQAWVETNSAGFREREFNPAPAGKKRIMWLGDSFTEAEQVEVEKTFPRLVETHLNRDTDAYRCFNLAIHGFGTGQEYLVCRDFIDTIRPDLVILGFFANNDVWDNSRAINYQYEYQVQRKRPLWKLDGDTLMMVPHDYAAIRKEYERRQRGQSLWKKSYFRNFFYGLKYRLTYKFRSGNKLNPATLNHLVYQKDYDEQWFEAWEITRRLILMIRDLAQSRGSRFLFVYIPDQIELYNDRLRESVAVNPNLELEQLDLEKPWNWLKPFLEENGIEHINLRENFLADPGRAGRPPRRLYLEYDAHFNEDGHRVAAEAITEKIINSVSSIDK